MNESELQGRPIEEPRRPWPDPTPEMLQSPAFEAVWQCIKKWDINVPDVYGGYCGATGNHVRAVLEALLPVMPPLMVMDAALELHVFSKNHAYPQEGSPEFFKLTELYQKLEVALRRAYPKATALHAGNFSS